jgi:hypothetical protein
VKKGDDLMSAAQPRKKLSDLLGEEEDLQVPFGGQPAKGESAGDTGEPASPNGAPEPPETDGTDTDAREGENARQARSQRDLDGDEDDGPTRDRTATARNRGKADTTRGGARGRTRQAGAPPAVKLTKTQRDDWRWRLRSRAGKLQADRMAFEETAQSWEDLIAEARKNGVPDTMIMVALVDAGIEDSDTFM